MLFMNTENSTSRSLIQIAWENTILECGLGSNFLCCKGTAIRKIITHTWITSMWEFSEVYNIQIQQTSPTDDRRFPNDFYLMAKAAFILNTSALRNFNYCRIFLQVNLLSDVLTADGRRIPQDAWEGIRDNETPDFRNWPPQPRPTEALWRDWRSGLKQIIAVYDNGTLHNRADLIWFKNWTWFYCPSETRLYCQKPTGLVAHSVSRTSARLSVRRGNRFTLLSTPIIHDRPPASFPVTTYKNATEICISGSSTSTTWHQEPEEMHRLWSSSFTMDQVGQEDILHAAFLARKLVIVSDGSEKNGLAAAAWIITSEADRNEHFLTGSARIPGNNDSQDSHRAESCGILGGLFSLSLLLAKWNITQGEIVIACDNISALKTAIDLDSVPFISANIADYDIMQSIRRMMSPGIKFTWKHVKGHQDDSDSELDPLAELNVRMDTAARIRRELIPSRASSWFPILPQETWKIWAHQRQITKKVEVTIRESISEHSMKHYWSKKGKISLAQFDNVGWKPLHQAMKSVTIGRAHWMAKHASGICGVNSIRQKWKERDNPDCPRCGLPETAKHVWQCQHSEAKEIWEKAIIDVQLFLVKLKTDPVIVDQLCKGLQLWYQGENLHVVDPRPLIIAQCNLGWDAFLEGFISKEWGEQQQAYYVSKNSRKTGYRWTVALILKLWNIAWDLWSHRNGYEHKNDLAAKTMQLDEQIEFLIEFHVPSPHDELELMFSEEEIAKVRAGMNIYKSSWILNVEALTNRISRRQNSTREITGMRRIMHQFLRGNG
jgi:ribonuclease HI